MSPSMSCISSSANSVEKLQSFKSGGLHQAHSTLLKPPTAFPQAGLAASPCFRSKWKTAELKTKVFHFLLGPPSPCCCLVDKLGPTFCNPIDYSMPVFLSFIISRSLLKLMFIELVMPSSHLVLCGPLLLSLAIFPCIRVFFSELALRIRLAKGLKLWLQCQCFHWIFRVDFLWDWLVLISLLSKGLSRVFSLTISYQIPQVQPEQNWTTSLQHSRPWSHSSMKAHERSNKYNQYNDDNNIYMSHILSV